jgi:class 3 adenylate cyclase
VLSRRGECKTEHYGSGRPARFPPWCPESSGHLAFDQDSLPSMSCSPHNRVDRFSGGLAGMRAKLSAAMERPRTRYVDVGDADVAYQVLGRGPLDAVYLSGWGHIDLAWDDPVWAAFVVRLASFSRLILFDRRGTGASDAVPDKAIPTWEEWADDVRAVLDAAGSEHAAVCAEGDSGPTGLLFTAMHPERVSALILGNTTARYLRAENYPFGIKPEDVDGLVEGMRAAWGTPNMMAMAYPSRADDPEFRRQMARAMRAIATPRSAAAQIRYMMESLDAREALSLIRVPTLVLHTQKNRRFSLEHGRYLADHIAGARFVELPGGDVGLASSAMAIEEITEFLTGERPPVEVDRILTTLLFTDIVSSTERAAALGDRAWRSLLDAHDRTVREQLRRFRGREISTTGDGFVTSFDGPARAIRCALAIKDAVLPLGLDLHLGLHTGECEVRGDDLGGLTVHIAARVAALAAPGEILVSGTVRDLVIGSRIDFVDRGEHELKGVPGSWRLFVVTSSQTR